MNRKHAKVSLVHNDSRRTKVFHAFELYEMILKANSPTR